MLETYSDNEMETINQILLEKIRVNLKREINKYDLFAVSVNLDSFANYISDSWIHHLKMDILGERDTKKVEVPASWWQMLKQDHLPEWFVERFPVKFKEIGFFEYCVLYPHLKISLPEEKKYVTVMKYEPLTLKKKSSKSKK